MFWSVRDPSRLPFRETGKLPERASVAEALSPRRSRRVPRRRAPDVLAAAARVGMQSLPEPADPAEARSFRRRAGLRNESARTPETTHEVRLPPQLAHRAPPLPLPRVCAR